MMVYYLEDHDQIKEFINKLNELKFKPPLTFYVNALIYFIEDYEYCNEIKNTVLQRAKRKHSNIFIHQILLSKSREQAASIIKEAREYGIELSESWADSFDSLGQIRNTQQQWRKMKESFEVERYHPKIYEKFCKLKQDYFNGLSLIQLRQTLLEQPKLNDTRKTIQTSVFNRSVYVKEFAKRVAKGICQLCDKYAPFMDKQGSPFLEVHHIHHLARGGSDTIGNVVALCPNCHRKIHQLELQEDVKKITNKALKNLNI